MRLLQKIKAALAGLCSVTCQRARTQASHWLPPLFMLALTSMAGSAAIAATEPETTLTNVVKVSYTVGSGASIDTEASVSLVTSKRTPAQIAFYSIFEGGTQTTVPATQFSVGDSAGTEWASVNSDVEGSNFIIETFSFSPGEPLIIRVEDFDQNLDASVQETITIDLAVNNTGDTETLLLTESEPGSGVFVGVIQMVGSESISPYDGFLTVETLSRIGAIYTDVEDDTDTVNTLGIVEPSNLVFDSTTGEPINGAVISLISAVSGDGARVYTGDDGATWPSTVISGQSVNISESARNVEMGQGEFRFPRVFQGEYYLKVDPPVGYRYPSQQSQVQLSALGEIAEQVDTGSRGETFLIDVELGAVLLNIPLDPFDGRFSVAKKANVEQASIGDEVEYTITIQNNDPTYELNNVYLKDTLPPGFRYIEGSATFSNGGTIPAANITVDGRNLQIAIGGLLAGASDTLTYRTLIGAGTPDDEATNSVQGFSDDATSNVASATVEMIDELMHEKNILIGRVFSGKCDDPKQQYPVKNARLYLNNGRTVLTDDKGRWHMEGLDPGTYVIQLDESSLRHGVIASPCQQIAQHTGKRYARMLQLNKGNLWRADFHVALDENVDFTKGKRLVRKKVKRLPAHPLQQFGADFAAKATPGFEFLWPPENHVPAISTMKVAVQYPPKNRLEVLLNGEKISPINLQGTDSNKAKTVGISRWTGVDVTQKNNTLTAILRDKSGKELKRITRHVHFTEESIKASLVESESVLLADGRNQPVIAIRLEDQDGFTPRPRTHGFYSLESEQWKVVETKSTTDTERVELNTTQDGKYEYKVSDDGLVRVRLEPTTRSGMVTINVQLTNGETGTVRAWLKPALRDWIMVGYAKGTLGYQTLSGNMQTLSDLEQEEGRYTEGRVSFFAKGRIKGDYLLTLAYDSHKKKGEVGEQLSGTVDPDAWYTLYGDEQTQQFEASSSSKLYVKLEKDQFYALFGDYHTNLDVTRLGRYERTLHGIKSSYEGKNYQYTAFVSETSQQYQRDEIRGDGTSGLYYLSREAISNSENIRIETRDRENPEVILETRSVSRYTDYDIDYQDHSLFFKFPISGSDDDFNPVYIVVEYESDDEGGEKEYVAGGRVGYTSDDERIKVGLSYLRDNADEQLVATDATVKVNDDLTLKAEIAHSDTDVSANAWIAEAEYRKDKLQGKVYANQQDEGFGLGHESGVAEGERKIGANARYQLSDDEAFLIDASRLLDIETDNTRVRASAEWQKSKNGNRLSVGVSHLDESIDGEETQSQALKIGAGKVLDDGRLALMASLEKTLRDVESDSAKDRLRLGADYKLTDKVSVFAEQEFTRSQSERGSDTRIGLKSQVWEGGNLHTDIVRESDEGDITQSKDYFLLGLSQHWKVNEKLHLDFSFDRAHTLDLEYYAPLDGSEAPDSDDYYAISIGAGWNSEKWSAAGRLEYRDSETAERTSLQYKALRKHGDHYVVSKHARVIDNREDNGNSDREATFGFSFALRSKDWDYTLLNQLDLIDEKSVTDGEVERSRKLINNLHYNRTFDENIELSLHYGLKLTQSQTNRSHWGVTDTLQAAARYDINESWDAGVQGGVLRNLDTDTTSGYAGISLGFTPAENTRIEIGYNFEGFDDDDFSSAQYTREGPYISLNYMLDQSLLKHLNKGE